MKIRKRHRKPRKIEGTGCDADPVMRAPLEVERGEDEVETPGGFVRVDKGFDTPAASEGGKGDKESATSENVDSSDDSHSWP